MLKCKVWTVTKVKGRDEMGDRITEWLRSEKPSVESYDVRQSSDNEYHCFTIVVWYT